MNSKALLFLVLTLIATGCSTDNSSKDYIKSVCISEVSASSTDSVIHLSGVVKSGNSLSLGFKTAGQISKIYVKEGDKVSTGQLLANLDDADYKLGVEALQIQYDQLSKEVNRARRLFEKKSMSANDYEKAEAGLKQLGIQLQANRNKLAYTRLYATSSGVIESVKFSAGEMVDAGTSVFSMFDTSEMEVVCDIPTHVYNERGRFKRFSCRPSSEKGEYHNLRLLNIVPKADENQLYRMYLAFDGNASKYFTTGMNVDVIIYLQPSEEGLSVPAKAIFNRDGNDQVWIVNEDSTITAYKIEIDRSHPGKQLRVISGLNGGEKVVRAGVSALHDGEKVKIVEAPKETNIGGAL